MSFFDYMYSHAASAISNWPNWRPQDDNTCTFSYVRIEMRKHKITSSIKIHSAPSRKFETITWPLPIGRQKTKKKVPFAYANASLGPHRCNSVCYSQIQDCLHIGIKIRRFAASKMRKKKILIYHKRTIAADRHVWSVSQNGIYKQKQREQPGEIETKNWVRASTTKQASLIALFNLLLTIWATCRYFATSEQKKNHFCLSCWYTRAGIISVCPGARREI